MANVKGTADWAADPSGQRGPSAPQNGAAHKSAPGRIAVTARVRGDPFACVGGLLCALVLLNRLRLLPRLR